MKIIDNTDLFINAQPKKPYGAILSEPLHKDKIAGFDTGATKPNCVSFSKMNLRLNFPDENGYLEKCFEDFYAFLQSANIVCDSDGMPLVLEFDKTYKDEAFLIDVQKDKCTVKAGHTKGIRRALIYIEDEFQRTLAPLLPIGKIFKQYKVQTRITRCLFTPYLLDATFENVETFDFAPDGYLNRLAHDGVNGIFIGVRFAKMLKSKYMADYGRDQDVIIPVINKVVQKCKQYGVDVYLFASEPASTLTSPLFSGHPEFFGGEGYSSNIHLFCPSTEVGINYIKESITNIFTLIPGLGGLLNISTGEGLSTCGSYEKFSCPRCKEKHKTLGRTLAYAEHLIRDTMKKVAPEAKLISWTYNQRSWKIEDTLEACRNRDKDVYHMVNFEDWGRPKQLGRRRYAQDYWLSYVGPGELIKACEKANRKNGVEMFAKLQVCSSHEISTVPYVPVPGILFDKYKYISKSSIVGAVLSWDFGNFPSLMNKASSELSLDGFYRSKKQFLNRLGRTYYGSEYGKIVKAWTYFEKAYKNYPTNLAFEWFGPMQDSPCAPLFLKPIDKPLCGTWMYQEKSSGDRVGECLLNGHTIEEALVLVGNLCEYWDKGIGALSEISAENREKNIEQFNVAIALRYIFNSGLNFLKFYELRHLLGTKQGDGLSTLSKMREIVAEEIENSRKLLPIVEKDKRIGFHSYGYKILPEKLTWRIEELNKLLETEFVEVENRIQNNQTPLGFYFGEETPEQCYALSTEGESVWKNFVLSDGGVDEKTSLRAFEHNGKCTVQIKVSDLGEDKIIIKPEFNIMFPKVPLWISRDTFGVSVNNNYSVPQYRVGEESKKFEFTVMKQEDGDVYSVSFDRRTMGMQPDETFRLSVSRTGAVTSTLLKAESFYSSQLIRGLFSPQEYCFFIKK